MGYGLWAMGYGLWAMGYGLWAMGYGLWAMGYGRWAMGDGRWAMGDEQEKGRFSEPAPFDFRLPLSLRLYLRADFAGLVRGAVDVHVEPARLVVFVLRIGELGVGRHGPDVVTRLGQ